MALMLQRQQRAWLVFASAHVLHNLIKPIKMPWESNPVLNPKRAFCSTLPNLGQSVVGMRDFACNVGNSDVSEAAVVTSNLSHSIKRARLASCVSSPDDMRLRALSLIRIMVDSGQVIDEAGCTGWVKHGSATASGTFTQRCLFK